MNRLAYYASLFAAPLILMALGFAVGSRCSEADGARIAMCPHGLSFVASIALYFFGAGMLTARIGNLAAGDRRAPRFEPDYEVVKSATMALNQAIYSGRNYPRLATLVDDLRRAVFIDVKSARPVERKSEP